MTSPHQQQRKRLESVTPYSETFYHHVEDFRTLQQKDQQHKKIEQIYLRNLLAFSVHITEKKKVKYEPRALIKCDLGEGWYCYITDNGLKNRQHTILTVHGAPGDHRQWAGLEEEMAERCRWVNLIIPGFDQEDQRRGTYTGTSEDFAKMIIKLMDKLRVAKIIYCGHSLGSIYASYFIDKYPSYVSGYINVTGIANHWYTGLLGFFNKAISQWGLNSPDGRKLLFSMRPHQRQTQHARFLAATDEYHFGPAQFPKLTINEYYAYIKLFNTMDRGMSQNYLKNMKLPVFRVMFFGKKDPLHMPQLTEAAMHYFCFDQQAYTNGSKFQKVAKVAEKELKDWMYFHYGINNFKAERIQEYFVYHFDNTGHNAHKRRPKEMAKIIGAYLECLTILQKYEGISNSSL